MLPRVVRYLELERAIPHGVLAPLIDAKSVYADARGNAVFLHVNREGRAVGAELRGTTRIQWRGMAAGSRKARGYFAAGPERCTEIVLCESAIDALLSEGSDALRGTLAFLAEELNVTIPHGGTRAFFEDLESLLSRLARTHPEQFESELESRPALRSRFVVLSAIGAVETARTTGWLLDGLGSRDGSCRWLALSKLVDRRAPEVVPRLRGLLRDRDNLVRFEARSNPGIALVKEPGAFVL